MSRSFGGTRLTTRLPMRISPDVMFSSPAIIRSRVDLPHPDRPTSPTNSPSSMRTSTPWMTSIAPKAFLTSRIATEAMKLLPSRGPFGRPSEAPAGSFRMLPNICAAMAGATPGLRLDGIIPPISIPRSLQMHLIRAGKYPFPEQLSRARPWGYGVLSEDRQPIKKKLAETGQHAAADPQSHGRGHGAHPRDRACRLRQIRAAHRTRAGADGGRLCPEVAAGHLVVIATARAVDGYLIAWPEADAYLIDNIAIDPVRQGPRPG